MTQGFDRNRLSLLLAMLERSAGLNLLGADVYLNMVGGIEVEEPAADLGTVAAVVSSFRSRPIPGDTAFIGEVGLAGEVRSVPQAPLRIKETAAMGFRRLVAPAGNVPPDGDAAGLELVPVARVREMLDIVF
jgi:DNA repair protein RadA/Sms